MGQRVFVVLVGALAVAAVTLTAWGLSLATPMLGAAFLLTGLAVESLPAHLRDEFAVSLSSLVIFTAVIVGGAPLAAVAAGGAGLAVGVRASDRRLQRLGFNAGQLTIAAAAAGLAYGLAGGVVGQVGAPTAAGLALAVPVYTVLNHTAVAIAIRLTRGERVGSTLRSIRDAVLPQVAYAMLSVVAAALILDVHPATLVLLVVPLLVARSGLLGFQELDASYERLVRTIAAAIELKDPYTRGHAERVSRLATEVAQRLGYDFERLRMTRYAALLHDIGKVAVPIEVLTKPGPLTDEEFAYIRLHPELGAEILADIDFLRPALGAVRFHHERLDGRGYPLGLAGDQVPEVARIVTVVDAFDALTSTRPYRRAWDVGPALAELRRCAGPQFDPAIVELAAEVVGSLAWEPVRAEAPVITPRVERRSGLTTPDVAVADAAS